MKELLLTLFGEYVIPTGSAILTTTEVSSGTSITTSELVDVPLSGMSGVDWPWIAGVFLFGIVLFCFFKLVGGLLK